MPDLYVLLWMRGIRAFGDGFISLLLPTYLIHAGFNPAQIGVLASATLLGSGCLTLSAGAISSHYQRRTLLQAAALLRAATGVGFAFTTAYWPLLVIAFIDALNPSNGDVSIFLPVDHSPGPGPMTGGMDRRPGCPPHAVFPESPPGTRYRRLRDGPPASDPPASAPVPRS